MVVLAREEFKEELQRLGVLCGYRISSDSFEIFYRELKDCSIGLIREAFDLLIEEPPLRLNLKTIKMGLAKAREKTGEIRKDWNGKECKYCDRGLLYTVKDGYSCVFRCHVCRSSLEDYIPFYSRAFQADGYRICENMCEIYKLRR
jgi:hypothetical protein